MKKIISLLMCIMLILVSFSGCNQTATPTETSVDTEKPTETVPVPTYTPEKLKDEVIYDGELYKLERIDGQCYIIIKDQEALMTEEEIRKTLLGYSKTSRLTQIVIINCLEFSSFTEFVRTVKVNGLSVEQLSLLNYNHRSSNGKIKVCEFDRIYYPALPDGCDFSTVYWHGEYYECDVHFGSMAVHTENFYFKQLNALNDTLKSEWLIKTVDENNPDMFVYINESTQKTMQVVYKIIKNDISYTVHEEYESEGSPYPYKVTAYGEGTNVLFTYTVYTRGILPDRDWITEFSVQRGIPN